jgi:hypothetical protein
MGHLQEIFLQILEYQVKIFPEDGPYRPKHVVMIIKCSNKAHTHTVAIDGLLPYLLL